MGSNPTKKNEVFLSKNIAEYLDQYSAKLFEVLKNVSKTALDQAFQLLQQASKDRKRIYVAGNGGSAAISDHLCCDWVKGTHVAGAPALRVHSLVSNTPFLTALVNDYGQERSLAFQIETFGDAGDILVLISSSGNSSNIVAAAHAAKAKKMRIIGLSGFDGGELSRLADVSLHVAVNNYGITEDAHQALMHVIAQYLASVR